LSLFAIGDLHLSFGTNKPMDIFGGWDNYVERLKINWLNNINEKDTVVIVGDLSWGMSLEQANMDFSFVNSLSGKKIILKGNHDYWWTTKNKMEIFFDKNGYNTLNILNNNHFSYDQYGICGTRGWINDTNVEADKKVLLREAGRLNTSIESAKKDGLIPIVFLHYPPIYATSYNYEILEVLHKHDIKQCFYGHIHGKSCEYSINGERDGIKYTLISSDFIQFDPYKILWYYLFCQFNY